MTESRARERRTAAHADGRPPDATSPRTPTADRAGRTPRETPAPRAGTSDAGTSGAGTSRCAGAPASDPARVLRPVRTGNGFEEALEQILQIVRLGLVPSGGRLPPERALAARLGVSRGTLREVLRVLQDEGVVESRRGRYGGTFVLARPRTPGENEARPRTGAVSAVSTVDVEDVEDVLRFREVLETGAAQLCAAQGLGDDGAGRLRAALARTHDAPLDDYRRQDTLLHLTLAELAGSAMLTAQYAAVRATLNDLLDRIPLLVRNLEHSQRQHTALVTAVLAGEPERARAVMREHCAGTAALLRGFLTSTTRG